MSTQTLISVIVPANNEMGYIGPCLAALAQQDLGALSTHTMDVIVAANACTDSTIAEAEQERAALERAGWRLTILDIATPGKLNALNEAEEVASGSILVYLDADVIIDRNMIVELAAALDVNTPRYASGQLVVAPARSWVTRRFATTWQKLPFMTTNVQGAGLFAVNRAGRARWGDFPDIIADDGYVRLMFAPDERIKVNAAYHWPMVEGFGRLVHVRRRQDAGVQQLAERFPEIMQNESKPPMRPRDHLALLAQVPVSYVVYVSVMVAVKLGRTSAVGWTRGR